MKRPIPPEWLLHDAWFTPGDVAEQVLRGIAALGVQATSIIDLGSGAGVWLQRAAFVFPQARRIAVEIRHEERPHLERWADEIHVGDFRDLDLPPVDLVVGNFAFKWMEAKLRWSLARARHVVSIAPASVGTEEGMEDLLRRRPPTDSLRLAGRIAFMYGVSDFQHHEALLWGPPGEHQAWTTHPMPLLPPGSRRWIVRPGEELTPRPLAPMFWPRLHRAQPVARPAGRDAA